MLENSLDLHNISISETTKFPSYKKNIEKRDPSMDPNDPFYASMLSQTEDPVGVYEEIEKELEINNGLSPIINSVRAYYKRQKDLDQALAIEGIIADESISVEQKKEILKSYSLGRPMEHSLQDEYLNFLANSALAQMPNPTEEDLEMVDYKIATTKLEQSLVKAGEKVTSTSNTLPKLDAVKVFTLNNLEEMFTGAQREGLNLLQIIAGAIPVLIEVAGTAAYQAASALGEKAEIDFLKQAYPDVNWEDARKQLAKISKSEEIMESLNEFLVEHVPGYDEEDMQKGILGTLLDKVGKGIEVVGGTLTPEDPKKGQTLLELALFFIDPAVRITRKAFKKDLELPKKNKLKQSVVNAIESPDIVIPNAPKPTSPFVEAVRMHPKIAEDMAAVLMEDMSGRAWKAMNITPEEFFATYYGPRVFDFERSRVNLYDATDAINLKYTEHKLKYYKQQQVLESVFKDVPERLEFGDSIIQDIGGILEDPNIRMINSDLQIGSSGTTVYVSTSFRKGSTEFYTNPREVLAYANYIEDVLARQYRFKNQGKKLEDKPLNKQEIVIEFIEKDGTINYNKSRTLEEFRKTGVADDTPGQYNIRWQRVGDFTPTIRKNSSGFGFFGHQDKPVFKYLYGSKSQLDKLFFNYGGISPDVQIIKDMGGLKAFNVLYTELESLVKLVNKQSRQYREDLGVILNRLPRYYRDKRIAQGKVYEKITEQDLSVILNHTPEYIPDLMTAVNLIEDINYFKWQSGNVYEINRGLKSGYVNHVVLEDFATGNKHNFLVKNPDETLAININEVLEVLDIDGQKPIALTGNNYKFMNGKHYLVDTDGMPVKEILRLGKEYVGPELVGPVTDVRPARGKHNYIAVDIKAKLGGIPDVLVPYKPYYMPMMVKDLVFIRRYPKQVKTDGKLSDMRLNNKDEIIDRHISNRETIGGFEDSRQANLYLETKILDEDNYVYNVEKADELSWSDANEFIKLQEQALKTSSRRGDHLRVATYFDPLMSILETSKLTGTRSFLQNVFEQQKIGWVKKWSTNPKITITPNKENLSRGEKSILGREFMDEQAVAYDSFPLTVEQIRPKTSADTLHAQQAIREWEALTEITSGFADDVVARAFQGLAQSLQQIAKETEKKLPPIGNKFVKLEKAALALEQHPSYLVDGARNYMTTVYTLWALPWKHWIQQPFQGMSYIATASNFNPLVMGSLMYDAASLISAVGFKQMKNKKLRAQLYDQMVKGMKIPDESGKGVSYKANRLEDLLYLHDSLFDRGVFNLNEHILAKGFANNRTVGLADGWFVRAGRNSTNFLSRLGLQTGEFMHRSAAAVASLHLWKQRNPNKSWRTPQAMDEVAQMTRQLTQSMDRMAVNTFQRSGLLKPFAQLQTFQARAGESILIGEATPFTGKQRVAQQVFNTLNLGVELSIPFGFGYMVKEAIAYMFGEDVADKLSMGVAIDIGLQYLADEMNPTYDDKGNQVFTTTRPSRYLSPYGDTPGLFYGDFVKQILIMMGFMSPEQRTGNVSLEGYKDLYANIKMMWNSLGLNKDTDVQVMAGIETLAKLTGGGKQLLSTYYYDTATKMVHSIKSGQESGIKGSDTDRLLTFLINSRPEGVRKQFEVLQIYRGQTQKIKELGNEFYDALLYGYQMKKLSIVELYDAIGGMSMTLKDVHGLDDRDMQLFWQTVETKNSQRNRSVKDNLLENLVKDMQSHLDDLSSDDLAAMREILRIFDENPQTNPDYEIILRGIQSRSGKTIGITSPIEVKPGD